MYNVKKYADCVAIHNLDNEKSRKLTEEEVKLVLEEFPALKETDCVSVFMDNIDSIVPGV